jgi:uncharacterized protein with ParB-like and HNH nuclease domain
MKNSIKFKDLFNKLGSSGIFKVDRYQRRFKWGKAQARRLFNDIYDWAKRSTDHTRKRFSGGGDYFVQSVALYEEEDKENIIQLVDGQQRITNIALLWLVCRNLILDNNKEKACAFYDGVVRTVEYTLTIPDTWEKDVKEYRLLLRGEDNDVFRAIVERNTEFLAAHKDNNVFKVYKMYYGWVKELFNRSEEEFKNFYFNGIGNVSTIEEICETQEEANRTFIAKNSTGLSVETGCVLASRIFQDANDSEYITTQMMTDRLVFVSNLKDYFEKDGELGWFFARFLYYALDLTDLPTESELLRLFDKYLDTTDLITAIDRIKDYMEMEHECERVNKNIALDVFRGLYLVWGDMSKYDDISLSEKKEIMDIADGFYIRRWYNGRASITDKLLSGFVKSAFSTKKTDESYYNAFVRSLIAKRDSGLDTFNFGNDNDLYELVRVRQMSSCKFTKHLLSRINDYCSGGEDQLVEHRDDIQIEHIIPRSSKNKVDEVTARYVETIGNYTILTGAWNNKLSNKPYSEKKSYYNNSMFRINRYFDNIDEWNADLIDERCRYFADVILKMWPITVNNEDEEVVFAESSLSNC